MIPVKIMLGGRFWYIYPTSEHEGLADVPLYAEDAQTLVSICNRHGLKVENKDALLPEIQALLDW